MKNEKVIDATITEDSNTSGAIMTTAQAGIAALADTIGVGAIAALANPSAIPVYCSLPDDKTRASAIAKLNAMGGACEKLSDHMGEPLEITDVLAHSVQLLDKETGEVRDVARVVLIAKDGQKYASVANGVISSFTRVFALVGQPHWDPPVTIKAFEQKTNAGFKTILIDVLA